MNDSFNLSESKYCGPVFQDFYESYRHIHGYTSLLVCLFGSVANTLNIAVLTRREMTSPTNAILTGLAVADLLVMLEYIPFACHKYLPITMSSEERFSYGWTLFVLFHSNFSQVCHTISIWLTVTLAVWRYIAIAHPQKNREWCRMETTAAAIAGAYLICPLLCLPIYLSYSIGTERETLGGDVASNCSDAQQNVTLYVINLSEMGRANDNFLYKLNFFVYSVIIKLIPCIALTILSLRLIFALMETKRRRQNLTSAAIITASSSNSDECTKMLKPRKKSSRLLDKEKQTDRTTKMLLAVLLLFLITEFPQGIMGLLSLVLGEKFFIECYQKLADIMDILALINSAINFILYCAMSRQFRTTFKLLFFPKFLNNWTLLGQHHELLGENGNGNTVNMTQVTQV